MLYILWILYIIHLLFHLILLYVKLIFAQMRCLNRSSYLICQESSYFIVASLCVHLNLDYHQSGCYSSCDYLIWIYLFEFWTHYCSNYPQESPTSDYAHCVYSMLFQSYLINHSSHFQWYDSWNFYQEQKSPDYTLSSHFFH